MKASFALLAVSIFPAACFGQTDLPRFGLGISIGTLGAGIQAATAVTRKSNVRGAFNYFTYSDSTTTNDNLAIDGTLRLASAEVLYDQFLGHGFHVSGGLMLWDGNQGTATVSVPGGNTITLNGQRYFSSIANPVNGTGSIMSRKVAPEVLFGFGNLLPRGKRRFSLGFELGVAFQGSANTRFNLTGATCLINATTGCIPIAVDPITQANIIGEQNKVDNDLTPFKYYPIVRTTFGFKF
jgi:hypothetical protein